jgi:hypothetical protein
MMKKLFFGFLIFLLWGTSANAALTHYWNLDQGSGTTATDSVGSLNGSLDTGVSWISGQRGSNALSFDNTSDGVVTFTPTDLGTTHSICFWLKFTDSVDGVVIGNSEGNGYAPFVSYADIYYATGSGNYVVVTHGGLSGEWHFVCIVRSGVTVKFYKDASQIGTDQTLGSNSNLSLGAFGAYTSGTYPTDCDLDEIRIYDTTITTNDMLALMGQTSSRRKIVLVQ